MYNTDYAPAAGPELGLLNPNWVGSIPPGGAINSVKE